MAAFVAKRDAPEFELGHMAHHHQHQHQHQHHAKRARHLFPSHEACLNRALFAQSASPRHHPASANPPEPVALDLFLAHPGYASAALPMADAARKQGRGHADDEMERESPLGGGGEWVPRGSEGANDGGRACLSDLTAVHHDCAARPDTARPLPCDSAAHAAAATGTYAFLPQPSSGSLGASAVNQSMGRSGLLAAAAHLQAAHAAGRLPVPCGAESAAAAARAGMAMPSSRLAGAGAEAVSLRGASLGVGALAEALHRAADRSVDGPEARVAAAPGGGVRGMGAQGDVSSLVAGLQPRVLLVALVGELRRQRQRAQQLEELSNRLARELLAVRSDLQSSWLDNKYMTQQLEDYLWNDAPCKCRRVDLCAMAEGVEDNSNSEQSSAVHGSGGPDDDKIIAALLLKELEADAVACGRI